MCIGRRPSPPPAPAPLQPAPAPPPPPPAPPVPPPLPAPLPAPVPIPTPIGTAGNRLRIGEGPEDYGMDPNIRPSAVDSQTNLESKKGEKGSTKRLRIKLKKNPAATGAEQSLNTGVFVPETGGIQ